MRFVGNALIQPGGAPVLYDDVRGALALPSDASVCRAWGLDPSGKRLAEIPVVVIADGFQIALGGYAHYEIVFQ
jgi:hypothetical protein